MAIDSRNKRFSMLNFGDGVIQHSLFEADGAIDADDRKVMLGLYAGIASSGETGGELYYLFRIFVIQ